MNLKCLFDVVKSFLLHSSSCHPNSSGYLHLIEMTFTQPATLKSVQEKNRQPRVDRVSDVDISSITVRWEEALDDGSANRPPLIRLIFNWGWSEWSHDVDLLRLRETENFFGSGTHHFVILADGQKRLGKDEEARPWKSNLTLAILNYCGQSVSRAYIVAVDISVGKHHRWVVFIHHLSGDLAN